MTMETDELLLMFQSITTNDHDNLVVQFSRILQIDNRTATFFLESCNWNVETAVNNYLSTVGYKGNVRIEQVLPEATFLSDLSNSQSVRFAPGSRLELIWSFRNSGMEPWPSDSQLIFVDGEGFHVPQKVNVHAEPGQQIDIPVHLSLPLKPGTYAGSWRLCCGLGYFGDPVWIIVNVGEPEGQSNSDIIDAMSDFGNMSVTETTRTNITEDMDL